MPQVRKECLHCGNDFFVPPCKAETGKFCSRACYAGWASENGSVQLTCEVCGKVYRRHKSNFRSKGMTCGNKCKGLSYRTSKPVSGDYPAVKSWMRRRDMIKFCNRCKYNENPGILVLHHIDRDRTNNDLQNLEILCPNCHALEHHLEIKEGWGHASTRRKR